MKYSVRGGVIPKLFDWIFPIGSVIANSNAAFDPNAIYKHQTWVRWAKGRTLVGIDEDDTDFSTVDKTGGEKTHKLTTAEMPSHAHSVTNGSLHGSKSGGGTTRTRFESGTSGGYAFQNKTQNDLQFVYSVAASGGSTAHNNLQPYVTVYYWKRTA